MRRVMIISMHKSYDYRIERHIRSLLKIGVDVVYYNITNEEAPTSFVHEKYRYIPLRIDRKSPIRILKIINFLRKEVNKNVNGYIFIQDPPLLVLVPFVKNKRRIVLDIHEIPTGYSPVEKLLSKYSKNRINEVKISALNIPGTIFMDNFPMISDFDVEIEAPQIERKRTLSCNFVYSGMITEENRQILKTLKVFEILLRNNIAKKIFLIGPVANRIKKEEIQKEISLLETKYPESFTYYGARDHAFVVSKLKESDFSFNLLNVDDTQALSPNKLYESMAAGVIPITNHTNYSSKIPEELMIVVKKHATPEDIVSKIEYIILNEDVYSLKKENRNFIISHGYYWERYLSYYMEIFKENDQKTFEVCG